MLIWNFKLRNPLLLLILVVPKKNLSIKLGKYQRDNLMLLRMSIASDIKFFLPKTKILGDLWFMVLVSCMSMSFKWQILHENLSHYEWMWMWIFLCHLLSTGYLIGMVLFKWTIIQWRINEMYMSCRACLFKRKRDLKVYTRPKIFYVITLRWKTWEREHMWLG
jgi:hypothetical protein